MVAVAVAQELQTQGKVSAKNMVELESLVYLIGKKQFITIFDNFLKMRRGNYFNGLGTKVYSDNFEELENKSKDVLENLAKMPFNLFMGLGFCVQQEAEAIQNVMAEKIMDVLSFVNLTKEQYLTFSNLAAIEMPGYKQRSVSKMEELIGSMEPQAVPAGAKRLELNKQNIIWIINFKTKLLTNVHKVILEKKKAMKEDPNFGILKVNCELGNFSSIFDQPNMVFQVTSKITEDLIAFILGFDPSDLYSKIQILQLDPEMQGPMRAFVGELQKIMMVQ